MAIFMCNIATFNVTMQFKRSRRAQHCETFIIIIMMFLKKLLKCCPM